MSSTFRKIVSLAAIMVGGFFLYTSYVAGMQYLPAPELPRQHFRKEHYDFAITAQSPFFYIGLILIGISIFIFSRKKK